MNSRERESYNKPSLPVLPSFLLSIAALFLLGIGFSTWAAANDELGTSVNINVSVAAVIDNSLFDGCENTESFGYNDSGFVVDGVSGYASADLSYSVGINTKGASDNGFISNGNQFTFNATLSSNASILSDSTYLTGVSFSGNGFTSSNGTIEYSTTQAVIPITLAIEDSYISSLASIEGSLSFTFTGITSSVVTVSPLTFGLSLTGVKA